MREELAMEELISDTACLEGHVVVLDRGLQSRNSFDKFTTGRKFRNDNK